ncbi:hypothetical protein [Cohnella abietis]|uniref:DUF5082 domain-containing protein n=1 Tax=Cohnella abietis TaxID=2507935 RepID=A0A3T1D2P8_9BACL|nr:hypothetical protein [Cohnella abietis]BBI32382.1 hypothetical protein KCTCHS21_17810 [Cohnella abietis]
MKKTQLMAKVKQLAKDIAAIQEQIPIDALESLHSDFDYIRDEVYETSENIPENFVDRREKWEEYHTELDEITNDIESLKESLDEISAIVERVDNFIADNQ